MPPAPSSPHAEPPPQAVLWRETTARADAIDGFDRKRGHRIPDKHEAQATRFFRQLAEAEVAREIEERYATLRKTLGYKRRQLQVTLALEAAAIATPDFEFHLEVVQDPDDAARARFRRTIQGVATPDVVCSPAFATAFGDGFDGLDLRLEGRIDVEALIDHLEDHEPDGWSLDYGHEATALRLAHPELPLTVHVTGERIRLEGPRPQAPSLLLEAADAALAAMGGAEGIGALALDG